MFDVLSIINNFQLVNKMNALLAVNEHIVNAILIENEIYNIIINILQTRTPNEI